MHRAEEFECPCYWEMRRGGIDSGVILRESDVGLEKHNRLERGRDHEGGGSSKPAEVGVRTEDAKGISSMAATGC